MPEFLFLPFPFHVWPLSSPVQATALDQEFNITHPTKHVPRLLGRTALQYMKERQGESKDLQTDQHMEGDEWPASPGTTTRKLSIRPSHISTGRFLSRY